MFVALIGFSTIQYTRERRHILDRLEGEAVLLGQVIRGSLRHALLTNDRATVAQILHDVGQQPSVLRVAVVNPAGVIRLGSPPEDFAVALGQGSPGCVECHGPNGSLDRHSLIITLPGQEPMLRSSILIPNEPACAGCHDQGEPYLGVLIADFSLTDLEGNALGELRTNLLLSTLATALVTAGVYGLMHWIVVRRGGGFPPPLRRFALGDLAARVPVRPGEKDELAELGEAVNRMAESLGQQVRLERRAREVRSRAIVEERQRLARELHDGVAQVIGFVSTKAMAARLMLKRGEAAEAVDQIQQIETAAQGVFADLRQAIHDLKTSVDDERGLVATLQEYLEHFQAEHEIIAELKVKEGAPRLRLSTESEVQILRIVQEALANVRKHSGAVHAWVQLGVDGGAAAVVTIGDDGRGFDPGLQARGARSHFGLGIMRERAEAVGGTFDLAAAPGQGTRITVTLPMLAREERPNGAENTGRG